MEKSLIKTTEQTSATMNLLLSCSTLQEKDREEKYQEILAKVPRSIDAIIQCPPISSLRGAGATIEDIEVCLAIEITKCAYKLTVSGNLRQGQSLEIAKELIATYPNESLEDFCFCLREGVKGTYGEIFRFDIMVIFGWFKQYLEKKYQAIEDNLRKEKDNNPYSIAKQLSQTGYDPVKHDEWLKKLQHAVDGIDCKKIPPITTKDILEEGQVNPRKALPYKPLYSEAETLMKLKLQRAASEFYKGRKSGFTLKIFNVDGIEFTAENEDDAMQIYELAEQMKVKIVNGKIVWL